MDIMDSNLESEYFVLSQEETLIFYMNRNDLNSVKKLLREGANPAKITEYGRSAIVWATGNGLSDMLRLLLASCEDDFNVLDMIGNAPIHYAAMIGDVTSLKLLLRYHSPVDIKTACGYTALHLAVQRPVRDDLFFSQRPNPNMYTAIKNGIPQVIPILIEAGADINELAFRNASTPLMIAIENKKFEIANALMDRGADIHAEDSKGLTALIMAVSAQNIQIVQRLLQLGARLSETRCLLYYCVEVGSLDMMKILINNDHSIDIRNESGWSDLLTRSIRRSNIPMSKYLINIGVKLSDDPLGEELHEAALHCWDGRQSISIAQTLIYKGIDVNCVDKMGRTPFELAIQQKNYELTEHLIKEGADANIGSLAKSILQYSRNADLIRLVVYSGLKIHSTFRLKSLHEPPWNDKDCRHLVAKATLNPLSLEQLARITIRNRIIEKITNKSLNVKQIHNWNSDCSIVKYFISKLNLPKVIRTYLYDFSDVPHLKNPT